jgi:hypothetical protein
MDHQQYVSIFQEHVAVNHVITLVRERIKKPQHVLDYPNMNVEHIILIMEQITMLVSGMERVY